ncbi:Formyltransferase [Biscogniauxia mediterranea]|nr:Formyltransferase [Biscogniauxia mediterranea]
MGTRAVIPGLRVFPLRAGASGPPAAAAPWRSPSHGRRAFRRTRDLQAVPATTSPLSCSSPYLRGFSTTTTTVARALHQEDPPAGAPGGESEGVKKKKKKSEPLNILFCGSDGFSCALLETLHAEHLHNRELIRSIEVVVRPGKRIGRGLKKTHDLRSLAEHLGLPIHIRDTFTGWDMPSTTNLIIAVSFGLRVPPRLLRASQYGGLNVHPSLLPDLRGPAPLHHALLRRRALAGVTLQTLHPTLFDHGVVLAQTPADPQDPACIRVPPAATPAQLLVRLLQPAGDMLVRALRAGLHVPPLVDAGWEARLGGAGAEAGAGGGKEQQLARERLRVLRGIGGDVGLQADEETCSLVHAPKITTADRQVRLSTLFAPAPAPQNTVTATDADTEMESDLSLRQRVIGPLWFYAVDRRDNQRKRIIIVKSSDPSSSSSSPEPPNPLSKALPPTPEPPLSSRTPQILSSVPSPSSSTSSSSPRAPPPASSRIIIRFLDDPDPNPNPNSNPNPSAGEQQQEEKEDDNIQKKAVYLSLAAGPAPPGKREDEHGCVYFGRDFRVEQLKVEGSKTRPARQALRNFVVGEVGPDGQVRAGDVS